jgi:preprotein translocase subunit SecF
MSLIRNLYRGETRFNFIGSRRRWYAASAIVILICIISFAVRGFNIGVEFKGGTQFQIDVAKTSISTSQVEDAFSKGGHTPADAPQEVGSGSTRQIVVKTKALNNSAVQTALENSVASDLKVPVKNISVQTVSSSWGHQITKKAIEGLIIFLIVVSIYIAIRFDWRMAVAALVALLHDLLIAAGIYSIIGFEVTPSTVVGLLTILGFSLYDTVVVFDKISENSKGLLAGSRMTYSDAANLAVNQTLMRSINTSLIALLPVAGLLFVGSFILGVGTIKDLALILFVGLASGAYSSLFLAAPVVCELTERQPAYKSLAKRVATKRAAEAKGGELVTAGSSSGGLPGLSSGPRQTSVQRGTNAPAPAPKPGARPQRPRKR